MLIVIYSGFCDSHTYTHILSPRAACGDLFGDDTLLRQNLKRATEKPINLALYGLMETERKTLAGVNAFSTSVN